MKRWFVPGFLAILALALALRVPRLGLRPLHNDEAVNAIKFRGLWNDNNYKYDPNEFHGPALPYFTLPFVWLDRHREFNDFSEALFRIVPVAFGTGLILLLLLLTPEFGRAETLWAALFLALSPAMVFYSRYYIHEMLLVFFTALAASAWWWYGRSGKLGWVVLAGVGLGLMWASKETFVFALFAMALAAASAAGWSWWRSEPGLSKDMLWKGKSLAAAAAIAFVLGALFFSSFLKNPGGLADAFKTYGPWLRRGEGGSVHEHPWNFYFERLLFYRSHGGPIWTEALIAGLAVIGWMAALASPMAGGSNVALVRVIGFYTAWLALIYTGMPYKTPWCLLGFWHGAILLAGAGAATLVRWFPKPLPRVIVFVALIGGTLQLGCQAWQQNFAVDSGGVPYCDSPKIPYTYSQTAPDIARLMQTVDGLAHASPAGYGTIVEVMSPESYWPLPWYLRRFKSVGYWDKIPDQPLPPIVLASTSLNARFDERPEKTHLMAGYFELRPNVFLELYASTNLWTRYVKSLPPEKDF